MYVGIKIKSGSLVSDREVAAVVSGASVSELVDYFYEAESVEKSQWREFKIPVEVGLVTKAMSPGHGYEIWRVKEPQEFGDLKDIVDASTLESTDEVSKAERARWALQDYFEFLKEVP